MALLLTVYIVIPVRQTPANMHGVNLLALVFKGRSLTFICLTLPPGRGCSLHHEEAGMINDLLEILMPHVLVL